MADNNTPNTQLPSNNVLINRFFMSPQERAKKTTGKQIVKQFYEGQIASADSLNFFRGRNAHWINLLLWAKGSQNMQEFLDFSNVSDGNKAWVNMDMTQQRLAPKFVGTLVESMAKTKTYSCVEAIDEWSRTEKENRLFEALFRMHEVEVIAQLQQQSGVQLEPANAYVPNDELSARIHFEIEDKLPKEIRFEQMIQEVHDYIKFERIVNRKTLFDFVALNFGATKIEKLPTGKYTVRKCIPTNMIYNFFINDSGELEITMVGEFTSLKVRDLRSKYGRTAERPDGLTEEQIFKLAKSSTVKNVGTFNYVWDNTWSTMVMNQTMPYDDCNVFIMDVMVDCGEDIYYVEKPDAYGRMNIEKKSGIPYQQTTKDGSKIQQQKPDDVNIIKRTKSTWMNGVYSPYGDEILYWGNSDITIPDYTNQSKSLCPYTVVIPFNDGNYVPSLFERGMEPLKEYTTLKLKRKQLISQLRPSGYRIDIESARNIDLGNGDSISWEEVVRIYNATGIELYSSKGIDPLQKEPPVFSNTAADTAVQKIMEVTNTMNGIIAELRDLWGVPQYRDGSDVGDRTSGVLQEQQVQSSFNVTDFVLNANNQLWEETDYKLCLLHWNDIVKQEPESKADMLNTRFRLTVKTKSTEEQKQLIERDIDRYSQMPDANGDPSISPKDAMAIREIDNYKLQRLYLVNTFEENRKRAIQEKERLAQENANAQQASNDQAAKKAKDLQDEKIAADEKMQTMKYAAEKDLKVLESIGNIAAKGLPLPDYFQAIIPSLVPNVVLPLQLQNEQIKQGIQQGQQIAAEQEQRIIQQQGQQQMQEPPAQEQTEPQQEPEQQEQAEPQMA